MYSKVSKKTSYREIMNYTLPKLHTGKSWYVDFYCLDPALQEMRRKKYMLNNLDKISDKRRVGAEIITNVTSRLRKGWNPWVEEGNNRQYSKWEDIILFYRKYIEKLLKTKVIKKSTETDYMKRVRVLNEYNESLPMPAMYIYQFNLSYISDFLDYLLLDRDVSARTRNNYRTWLSSFCAWLMEKQYLDNNPVEKIKPLAEDDKKRIALSHKDLNKLYAYLKKKDKNYLLACRMLYYTFIRPEELTNIRLKDIFIKEQKVFIASTISKNSKDGMVGLNDELIKMMIDMKIFDNDSNCYLFSSLFKPGAVKITTRVLRDHFNRARKALNFPDAYQFYSLKDSGIRDLANSEGIVIARDQARHSDISTTNKYIGASLTVHEETKTFEGAF